MAAYYNENDPYAAQWLRNLIAAGAIAYGVVDERSISDVQPTDLTRFTQCHFFAGIGGWSLALRLAGWPDSRPVWTGSCPCQPFSVNGTQWGVADDRHLWPTWFALINACRPPVLYGEQVETAIGYGWFDLVSVQLEAAGYTPWAASLPASAVGAPHERNRLYFMADSNDSRLEGREAVERTYQRPVEQGGLASEATGSSADCFWGDPDWLLCQDNLWRPVEPGTFPLVDGIPRSMERSRAKNLIRGYGNAIVPPLAAAFIKATSP